MKKTRRPSADDVLDLSDDKNNNDSNQSDYDKIFLKIRGMDVKKNLSPITEEVSRPIHGN